MFAAGTELHKDSCVCCIVHRNPCVVQNRQLLTRHAAPIALDHVLSAETISPSGCTNMNYVCSSGFRATRKLHSEKCENGSYENEG